MSTPPATKLKARNGEIVTVPLLCPTFTGAQVIIPAGTKTLLCPTYKGARLIIPAGKKTWFRGGVRITKRTQTITVFTARNGYIEDVHHQGLRTVSPTITWSGSRGYWVDCPLTDLIFEANGFVPQVNERNLEAWSHYLEPVLETVQP